MFAVIRTGGKQYRVAKDDVIVVEKLLGEPGAQIALSEVLMIGGDGKTPTIGAPMVEKAAVFAEVVEQSRGDKIIVFKKNRRKNSRRTRGHRQDQTVLRIVGVSPTGAKPPAKAKAAPKQETKPEAKPKKEEKKETPKTETKAAPEPAKKKPAKKEAKAPKAPKAPKEAKAPTKKKVPAKKKPAAQRTTKKAAPKKKPAAKKKAPTKGKPKK